MAAVGVKEGQAAFLATWRDESTGEIVGSTWGATICWFPRKPWALKILRGDFEHIVRCGECPGCLEFERRRLADRLSQKYSGGNAQGAARSTISSTVTASSATMSVTPLFIIRIYAPLKEHARICHSLHRRRIFQLEPGMYRLGTQSFALLARAPATLRRVLKRLGLESRVEPVRLQRRRRAWRTLTAGLTVARSAYGEQVKRWYARGLPPAERQKWEVDKHAMQKPWNRGSGARARSGRRIILVPPELWRLRRSDRRHLRGVLANAGTPEAVSQLMGMVADLLTAQSRNFPVNQSAKGRLERSEVIAWYQRMKQASGTRRAGEPLPHSSPPSCLEGGYVSSVHSGNAPPVAESEHERFLRGERERREQLKQRDQDFYSSWAERMARKVRGS